MSRATDTILPNLIFKARKPRLMTDRAGFRSRPPYQIGFPLIAVASFLLYALGVLTLHQDRAPGWAVEAQGPIPVAVSYLIYRTPLGATEDNVATRFLHPNGTSVQDILATAATGSIPRGAVDPYWYDGLGAGENLFATAAMGMFGISISSLVLFYLAVVGISVFAFVLRYQDKRLIVVPLYFLALTVMLLTPLSTSANAVDQMPIGGQRYFVLAVFLPALYIFFEIIERSEATDRGRRILNSLLLFTQGLLLFGALLVRSSTSYVLGLLLGILIWQMYRARRERDGLGPLVRKSAIVAAAFGLWAVFVVTALPAYVHTGRVFSVFWHRAFISFALHPDWPFGDLRQVYNCTQYIPTGLDRTASDGNGQCVWFAYPANATRPPNEVATGLYGGEYERVLRNAYFYVLVHYPRHALELYLFYKSEYIKNVLVAAWQSLFELIRAPVAKSLFVIATTQLALFIAFIIAGAIGDSVVIDRRLLIFPILFLCSLAPLYVAWAVLWTSSDTIFLMYSCLVLASSLVVQFAIKALISAAVTLRSTAMSK
jgi:hypothetical protein